MGEGSGEDSHREGLQGVKVMDSFPNEESCVRIMFGLVRHLNEDWKYKPIRGSKFTHNC